MASAKNGQTTPASPAKSPGPSSSAAKASAPPSSGGGLAAWGGRALNLLRPNFGKDSPGKSGGSRITKLIFGTLIFVLVGQLLVTGLTILNAAYKLNLNQAIFPGAPWLSWFFAIYFVLLIGLWFALNYFGFFPKPEPLPANRGGSGSAGAKKGVTQIPGIGGPRVRARAPEVAAPASSGGKGATSKVASSAKLATSKAAPAASARGASKTAPAAVATAASGAYDDAYERVKAAQRQKRRRGLR